MGEVDTFGITLPVSDWQRLFALAQSVDRTPSDFLRLLIRREAGQPQGTPSVVIAPDPRGPERVGVSHDAT
jgi:hypothetical protein